MPSCPRGSPPTPPASSGTFGGFFVIASDRFATFLGRAAARAGLGGFVAGVSGHLSCIYVMTAIVPERPLPNAQFGDSIRRICAMSPLPPATGEHDQALYSTHELMQPSRAILLMLTATESSQRAGRKKEVETPAAHRPYGTRRVASARPMVRRVR